MPIVFDQIEGAVQAETAEAVPAPTASVSSSDSGPPELDLDKLARELSAAARRRERLFAE